MAQYTSTDYINNGDYRIEKGTIYPQDITHVPYPPSTRYEGKYQYSHPTMIYVENGGLLVSINKTVHLVQKHDLILLPGNTPCVLAMKFSESLSFYHIHLCAEINDMDWVDFFRITENNCVAHIKNKRLEECLQSIRRDDAFTTIEAYHMNRIAKLAEIIAFFLEGAKNNFVNIGIWKPVIEFMEQNMSRKITINDLAACVQYHPNYFIRKFKEDFDISPMKYFNNLRMKKALELVTGTDKSFVKIAYEVGFNDPYYFSAFFKEQLGMSPQNLRKLYLETINKANEGLLGNNQK